MGTKGELYFPIGTQITDPIQGTVYTLKRLLGRGAYAQCFLVSIETGETFALKIIKLSDLKSQKVMQKLHSEISIHSSLDHPNVVKMYTHFRTSEHVFMVLELCERGALDELLKRNGKIKERYVSKFITQLLHGLQYLHDTMSVVHRDLKLGNLFLDSNLNIKIGDFGLSATIKDGERRITVCGTPNYIAPEVLFGKAGGHSFEADVWSVGIIIYTLLVGKPPFQQNSVEEIYKKIQLNKYIYPEDCTLSSAAIDLINRILINNPQERPDLEQILIHNFLNIRENLANRVYRNLINTSYHFGPFSEEFVVYSTPINSVRGIGYILNSGICGIYYHDMTNAFLKNEILVFVRLKENNGKKIFVTEEHLISNIPDTLKDIYDNIIYFINNHARYFVKKYKFRSYDNSKVFVAKIKKIENGLLFVMTNNVFVFDYNFGARVALGRDGKCVCSFDDDGLIEFTLELKEACLDVLKLYCSIK